MPVGTVSAAVSRLQTDMNERFRQLIVLLLAALGVPVVFGDQIRLDSEVAATPAATPHAPAWVGGLAFLVVASLLFAG